MEHASEKPMSFEKAVSLFKSWGFTVEPGPELDEVTFWIDAAGRRTFCVYPARLLPEIAAVIQRVQVHRQRCAVKIHQIGVFELNGDRSFSLDPDHPAGFAGLITT
jgi:hypothetical protein